MNELTKKDHTNQESGKEQKLSSSTIRNWLREKEASFLTALKVYAKKNNIGFQINSETKKNEFTGAGLCAIASEVIEKVLLGKYGDQIQVKVFSFSTNSMDPEAHQDIFQEPTYHHYIVRFKVPGEDWYTIDPTYKQFQPKVKPLRMLIFPTRSEPNLYTYPQWHQRRLGENPDRASMELPLEKSRRSPNMPEDYMTLFEPFSE